MTFPAQSFIADLHRDDWYLKSLAQQFDGPSLRERATADWLAQREHSDLMRALRQQAYAVAVNVGMPPTTRLCWVNGEVDFWGAAGFADAPHSFNRPHILLHENLAARYPLLSQEAWLVHRNFLGVTIHESAHVTYTRKAFQLPNKPLYSAREKLFANLLEDNRIEALVSLDLPGYTPFLCAARKELHACGFAEMLVQWCDIWEADQATLLASLFIRAPEEIPRSILEDDERSRRRWMKRLREIMSSPPIKENSVWRMAAELAKFIKELDSDESLRMSSGNGVTLEYDQPTEGDYAPDGNRSTAHRSKLEKNTLHDLLGIADRLGNIRTDNLEHVIVLDDSDVTGPTSIGGTAADNPKGNKAITWSEAHQSPSSCQRDDVWVSGFHSIVQQLRSAWGEPPRRNRVRRGLQNGRLDRRRLPWATSDSRLFCRAEASPPRKKTDLILLLDASSSMQGERHRFATLAGRLVTEALP